jgi:uncharacterized protein YndB with AHSA1/START domain
VIGVPRVCRSRNVAAPSDAVWDLVSDPHHLPRWWPQVQRVEEVTENAWTKVLRTPRGKTVRADYSRVEWQPPRRLVWRQEIEESPFEEILEEAVTMIELSADGDASTRVELCAEQELHGRYRLGGFMLRRATKRQLDEALDGIEQAVGRS